MRQLAGLMAGRIEVTSEPGRGSVFAFEVHLEKIVVPVALTEDVAAGAAPQWFGARLLLAEDDPVSQLIAAEMLKKLGCRVDVVSDGAAACRSVEQQHYDLVLMDCHMPGMDGYRATERIRHAEAAGSQRVAIVALTADAQSGNRERCIASGMDDFLCKPITFEALRRTLERWGR